MLPVAAVWPSASQIVGHQGLDANPGRAARWLLATGAGIRPVQIKLWWTLNILSDRKSVV